MVEWYFSITSFFVRSVHCGMLLSRYRFVIVLLGLMLDFGRRTLAAMIPLMLS